MPRHIVCLTFDFDAMTGFIARGLTTPTPISRGEFGLVGVRRILDLLHKYAIKGSIFIPGVVIEMYPAACEAIVAAGHEIGHHGYTHIPPANLSRDQEAEGLARGNETIKRLSGQYARGYRSPSWDLSPYTVELLLQHHFLYDSSMMGDDYTPYYARQGDTIVADGPCIWGPTTSLLELPISWTLDDYPHFEFLRTPTTILPGLMNAHDVLQNWIDDFVYMQRVTDWGILTYTMHPYVIGRGHRMMMLERLILRLLEGGAVFMSMEEAAREFLGRAA
ncbi:MAG: polysaccharide deacetylase [Candidatus Tectomicrobia bacterium]|uniref:Polysaccharide deacetylase n=1 Tax=Tectimicrobiota bacterium TaxID=2528274 RepID=A0A937VYX1_UNCTE|nr:polysaccharide deacetylase [Candidatus Tectomicrobia bacterium]